MNTINPLTPVPNPAAVQRGSGASAVLAPTSGTDPTSSAQALQEFPEASASKANEFERPREDLQRELDDTLRNVQTSLRFRVDDEADRVVVSVVDRESGDLIYQIPSDAALQIAKRMAELGSGMINESA
jgi:flagellar protein FlaG